MIIRMSTTQSYKNIKTNRFEELDSLRGIAAIAVFFSHILLIFNSNMFTTVLFEYGLLRVFVAGSESVMLFFILSGFVLSLPFYNKKSFSYGSYTIKRICRIYLPYIFAVGLAFACKELFYDGKIIYLSSWFNGIWDTKISLKEMINHLILVNTFLSNLNNVVWSLVHEMRISLFFPLLMFLLIRLDTIKGVGIAFLFSVSSVLIVFLTGSEFFGVELFATLHYSALFIIGALLAKNREYLINTYKSLPPLSKMVLFLIGVILFVYAHPSFILSKLIPNFHPFYRTVIDSWFISAGACILIISALSAGSFSRILNNKVINYLGKISYSLYLTHIVVLTSTVYLFSEILPMWIICVLAVALTVLLSSAMYHIVEKGSMKLGKHLAKNLENRNDKKIVVNKNSDSEKLG